MFNLAARDRTATPVRFSWLPISRGSTPLSANDRRTSSSAGVQGLAANRPVSVISPSPSASALHVLAIWQAQCPPALFFPLSQNFSPPFIHSILPSPSPPYTTR